MDISENSKSLFQTIELWSQFLDMVEIHSFAQSLEFVIHRQVLFHWEGGKEKKIKRGKSQAVY